MRTFRSAPRRGQSLVLFAFSLLIVTLMVMMTIGFGVKAKEKMELQHLADAAAYSNAVATARALNGVSILNRAEVSVMVTLAATQSNISFASAYMGVLKAIETYGASESDDTTNGCTTNADCCAAATGLGAISAAAGAKYVELFDKYYLAGEECHNAGMQAESIQGAATRVHDRQLEIWNSSYNQFIVGQKLTRMVVKEATFDSRWPDEYVVRDEVADVSERELSTGAPTGGTLFAISPRDISKELGVKAAMGYRGDAFVRNRTADALTARLIADNIVVPPRVLSVVGGGSGHWTEEAEGTNGPHPGPGPAPYSSTGEDHGVLTTSLPGNTCPVGPGVPWFSYVSSTDRTISQDDRHSWNGEAGNHGGYLDREWHTMGTCTSCPGVWTMFIDLNPAVVNSGVQAHLYGQPKNIAAVRRNTNERCADATYAGDCGIDPWNLMFRFRFTPPGEDFDNRGLRLSNGDNISNQVMMATGLTYYHRPGHWREPPNFFNPFWRGTLTSMMVDSQGNPTTGSDVMDTIDKAGGPSVGVAQTVVQQLRNQGYRGW